MENAFSYRDLVTDDSFRDWVLTQENDRYWQDWIINHPEKYEDVEKAKSIIHHLKFEKHTLAVEEYDNLWNRIKASNNQPTITRQYRAAGKNQAVGWVLKIAASVLIVIAAGIYFQYYFDSNDTNVIEYVTKNNPNGQRSIFRLPDGSKITLNAGSTLKYPKSFNANERSVELSGEAFFEVEEDKERPFIVTTGQVKTTVLGTSFNISAYPYFDHVSVMLSTGSVKVSGVSDQLAGEHYTLNPGQQLIYKKARHDIELSSFNSYDIAWKEGVLHFNHKSLKYIADKLEVWYGATIDLQVPDAEKVFMTSTFKNQSLEHVLKGLSHTFRLTYKIEGKNITITKEK